MKVSFDIPKKEPIVSLTYDRLIAGQVYKIVEADLCSQEQFKVGKYVVTLAPFGGGILYILGETSVLIKSTSFGTWRFEWVEEAKIQIGVVGR